MKTRRHLFPIVLMLIALPNVAFANEDQTNGAAAEDCQALYERLTGRLVSSSLHIKNSAQRTSVETGLQLISQLLKIPKDNKEMMAKHAEQLGFKLNDQIDIKRAKEFLENAFPIFEVSLKDLRDFAPAKDVHDLLFDTCQRLIPIKVGEEVKSSVTIRLVSGTRGEETQKDNDAGWRVTRWGLPKLIGQLIEQKQLKEKDSNLKNFRLVSIPSLNRNFLGYKDGADIKLVPLVADRLFEKGKPLSAEDVFKRLSVEAKGVEDSPR